MAWSHNWVWIFVQNPPNYTGCTRMTKCPSNISVGCDLTFRNLNQYIIDVARLYWSQLHRVLNGRQIFKLKHSDLEKFKRSLLKDIHYPILLPSQPLFVQYGVCHLLYALFNHLV